MMAIQHFNNKKWWYETNINQPYLGHDRNWQLALRTKQAGPCALSSSAPAIYQFHMVRHGGIIPG